MFSNSNQIFQTNDKIIKKKIKGSIFLLHFFIIILMNSRFSNPKTLLKTACSYFLPFYYIIPERVHDVNLLLCNKYPVECE